MIHDLITITRRDLELHERCGHPGFAARVLKLAAVVNENKVTLTAADFRMLCAEAGVADKADDLMSGRRFFHGRREHLTQRPKVDNPPAEHWGRRVWKLIHTQAQPDKAWLDKIVALLPCGECKEDAIAYLQTHPPEFSNWPRYTWTWHNAVSRKIGKPDSCQISFEAAAREHGWKTD